MLLDFEPFKPEDLESVKDLQAEATAWLASKGLPQWQPGQPRATTPRGIQAAIDQGVCYVARLGSELVGTITVDDWADPEFWTPAGRPAIRTEGGAARPARTSGTPLTRTAVNPPRSLTPW